MLNNLLEVYTWQELVVITVVAAIIYGLIVWRLSYKEDEGE